MADAIDHKPTYSITEDECLGIIRVTVRGYFDGPALVSHFADKSRMVDKWRAMGRPIRVLIDAVDLRPHSAENQAYVERATARIYRLSDRVATLVASSLVKMQMRRALAPGEVANFFLSEGAAITWLTATRVADETELTRRDR